MATSNYKCPKCGGSDFFMSTRNVMKGVGGIYGNRGGVKKFPVCKVCDEIMDRYGTRKISNRRLIILALWPFVILGFLIIFGSLLV